MDLLISVTTPDEVAAAVRGGADIVDIKNPVEGALGASFPDVIRQVRQVTPADLPVSAALGDVPNLPGTVALAALGAASCGVQYVKVGLMGPRQPAPPGTASRGSRGRRRWLPAGHCRQGRGQPLCQPV